MLSTLRAVLVSTTVLFTAFAGAAQAQLFSGGPSGESASSGSPSELFAWTVEPSEAAIMPGDTLEVRVTVNVPEHHHVYAERTSVEVVEPAGIAVLDVVEPEPEVKFDKFEQRDVPQHSAPATYRILLRADDAAGAVPVRLTMRTQGCSETMCFFPTTTERTVTVTLPGEGVPAAGLRDYSATDTGTAESGGLVGSLDLGNVLAEHGIALALGLMFLGGLLTSFTPCVYPLIPITVSFFGASGASAFKGFLLSLLFVLGMATMYSILGVSAAATGSVFGSIMSNPVVIGVVAVVFIAFALSMFGAYKIQLPMSLQMRLQRVGGTGWGGAFLAGVVAGIIAAPCTGPVLGAALTYVATTGNLAFGFFSMFAFALGMGMLFIAIGTFSARIVPKGGAWLGRVESVFGIAMIVVALYFLKDVIPPLRGLMHPGTTALAVSLGLVVVGLLLGAVHRRFTAGFDREGNLMPPPSLGEKLAKGIGVALVVAGSYGAIGTFIAPTAGAHMAGDYAEPDWVYNEAEGMARAAREGKPVLIDAYADWCVACRELDAYTYSDERVLERLDDFVAIKLDFTDQTDATRELQRKYGIVGLPTVIIIDSAGRELSDRRLLGFEPVDDFLARLEGIE